MRTVRSWDWPFPPSLSFTFPPEVVCTELLSQKLLWSELQKSFNTVVLSCYFMLLKKIFFVCAWSCECRPLLAMTPLVSPSPSTLLDPGSHVVCPCVCQPVSFLVLPSTALDMTRLQMCINHAALCGLWGLELRSLPLHSNQFSSWAIPSLVLYYLTGWMSRLLWGRQEENDYHLMISAGGCH